MQRIFVHKSTSAAYTTCIPCNTRFMNTFQTAADLAVGILGTGIADVGAGTEEAE